MVTAHVVADHGDVPGHGGGQRGHGVPTRAQRLDGGRGSGQRARAGDLVAAEYLELLVPGPGQRAGGAAAACVIHERVIVNLHICCRVLLVRDHLVVERWELLPNRT